MNRMLFLIIMVLLVSCNSDSSIPKPVNHIVDQNKSEEFILAHDQRLEPYCDKLALISSKSTPKDIMEVFGDSEGGAIFISSCYESVHTLNNGCILRIRSGNPLRAYYCIPIDIGHHALPGTGEKAIQIRLKD